MAAVRPAILCGGIGSRLWPLSSPQRPKQFHALTGEGSLLRQTIERAMAIAGARRPIVVTGADFEALVREEAVAAGQPDSVVVLEPARRNTAASAALDVFARTKPCGRTDRPYGKSLLIQPLKALMRQPRRAAATVQK